MAGMLLLISSRPEDEGFAAQVAATAGLTLRTTHQIREGTAIIAGESPRIIFADTSTEEQYRDLENTVQETVGLFSNKIDANAIFFLSSHVLEKVPYLIRSPLFGHYLFRHYNDVGEAGKYYGRIVAAMVSDKAFGLAKLLKEGTKIQSVKLQSTIQKQSAVDAVKNYVIAGRFQTRMATVIANAVDELLMNAMFDAPVDNLGRHLYTSTHRATSMKLEGKQGVEIQVGFDGSYVGITAIDFFGSLDKAKLLSHLAKIYTEHEYRVKASIAGAGIGLATVFRSGGSFFFVSESQVRTEVTVFFKRSSSFREFKDQFKFISTQFYF